MTIPRPEDGDRAERPPLGRQDQLARPRGTSRLLQPLARAFPPVADDAPYRMRLPAAVQQRTSRWWPDTPEATDGRFNLLAVAALSLPVLGFWAPFFGFLVSLVLALYAVSLAGDRTWGPRRGRRRGVALLGFAAMWLPAVIAFSGVLYPTLGESGSFPLGSTAWLLLPLCGPEQILLPTLAATVVYAAGAVVSGLLRRPWPWVLGALLSALSYDTVMYVRSIDTVC